MVGAPRRGQVNSPDIISADEGGFNTKYLKTSHYVAEHNSHVLEHIFLRFIPSTRAKKMASCS